MLIGIISDTHDNVVNLKKAISGLNKRRVDLVIHCGDWASPFMIMHTKELKSKIVSVFGNNDSDKYKILKNAQSIKNEIELHDTHFLLEIDEKKIMIFHGDPPELVEAILDSQRYDVLITGHNHKCLVTGRGKTLYINPGTLSGVGGISGKIKATYALYNTRSEDVQIIELK